jgi:hypothetical protein
MESPAHVVQPLQVASDANTQPISAAGGQVRSHATTEASIMSSVIPRSKPEYITFFQVHEPLWEENLSVLGLSNAQLTSWKALNSAMQADYIASESARTASKTATGLSDESLRAARDLAAELVRLIKNRAIATNDPKIYDYAGIPAPTPPSELPPPGAPSDLRAILNEDGTLTLRWKTNNAKGVNGVVYMVRRRVGFGVGGPTEIVGITGGSSFLDDSCPTPPQSSPVIQYTVQGHRGGVEGNPCPVFSVFMGIGAGGGAVILNTTSNPEEAMKMAA